jgi:hypothetical protein
MKAEEFDQRFDRGEDVTSELDLPAPAVLDSSSEESMSISQFG